MTFSERLGIVSAREIQLESIDDALRNRIVNYLMGEKMINEDVSSFILDKLGIQVYHPKYSDQFFDITQNADSLKSVLNSCEWNVIYDVLEFLYAYIDDMSNSCDISKLFEWKVNAILEEEKSGYRMINGELASIVDGEEIQSIVESTNTSFNAVNTHMKKALRLYSDREKPDYENSIKESISAVEAMCCIITDLTGKKATLGEALKKLEDSGVHIHTAMKSAFGKLYGYTSDGTNIRHGGIDFSHAPAEDAKYMLVSCSAFINYLKEKYAKI